MPKFTFKKEARVTGLAGIASDGPSTIIKLGGREVGLIKSPCRGTLGRQMTDVWTIRLRVVRKPTVEHPCPWRWAVLRQTHASEPEARAWLIANAERILASLTIVED